MVEVKRKDNESFDSMLRRFSRRMMQSRVLNRARRSRFHEREKSKNIRRERAIKRAELREEKEELRRQGKISYNTFGTMNRYGRRK